MSLLERRLQLLLDEARYERVKRAADTAGRSVSAMIRESIDICYPDAHAERAAAAGRFLQITSPGAEPDFAQSLAAMADESERRLA